MTNQTKRENLFLRAAALVLLSLSVAFTSAPAGASTGSGTKTYAAGFLGDAQTGAICDDELGGDRTPSNLGGACFRNISGVSASVTIMDDALKSPGFWLEMDDATGNCIGSNGDPTGPCPNFKFVGCGTGSTAIPTGTRSIRVVLDGFAFGPQDCFGGTGAATNGSIRLVVT